MKAIDGPSFHRRMLNGDRRVIVQAFGETWRNMTKCGATEGSTVGPVKSLLSSELVQYPKLKKI